MFDLEAARKDAEILAAIADPTRVQILYRLVHGPQHVGQLAEALGVPMPNMSHHLGVMRKAGLLDDRKDGRKMVYSLHPGVFTPGDGKEILGTLQIGLHRLVIEAPKRRRTRRGG